MASKAKRTKLTRTLPGNRVKPKGRNWTTADARRAAGANSRKAAKLSKRTGKRATWSGVPGDRLRVRSEPEAEPAKRLEYLRGELRAERISYGELHELQSLAGHIKPGDTELLEAAGVPENTRAGAGACAVPASLGVSRARQLKPVHVPRGWGGLHVEAPGCIVNIQTSGLSGPNGEPMTMVSVSANGDRYAGETPWWSLPAEADALGVGVRIMQTKERPKPTTLERAISGRVSELAAAISAAVSELDGDPHRVALREKLADALEGIPEPLPAVVEVSGGVAECTLGDCILIDWDNIKGGDEPPEISPAVLAALPANTRADLEGYADKPKPGDTLRRGELSALVGETPPEWRGGGEWFIYDDNGAQWPGMVRDPDRDGPGESRGWKPGGGA